jgi:hypothetical protein
MPASVAVLCGPEGPVFLPACGQTLSTDGRFAYLGGYTPLAPTLGERAARLARRGVAALPPALGYIGFDLVLGESERGQDDVIVEVNPRLTTSYVGLRAACRANLGEAMLRVASGQSPGPLRFGSEVVRFTASGDVFRHGRG